MKLANKIAVITGAGSGIGRVASQIFAREGATVLMLDINAAALEETRDVYKRQDRRRF